jgi:hypothetical protein
VAWPPAWCGSSWQSKASSWIVRAAKESQDLADLIQTFNQEFGATFTEADLEDGYPSINRYFCPDFLDEKNMSRADYAIEEEEITIGPIGGLSVLSKLGGERRLIQTMAYW